MQGGPFCDHQASRAKAGPAQSTAASAPAGDRDGDLCPARVRRGSPHQQPQQARATRHPQTHPAPTKSGIQLSGARGNPCPGTPETNLLAQFEKDWPSCRQPPKCAAQPCQTSVNAYSSVEAEAAPVPGLSSLTHSTESRPGTAAEQPLACAFSRRELRPMIAMNTGRMQVPESHRCNG